VRGTVSILVSLARLGHAASRGVVAALAAQYLAAPGAKLPRDMLHLLWALGRCGHREPALLSALTAHVRAATVPHVWRALTGAEQSDAIRVMTGLPWALATADWRDGATLDAVRLCVRSLHGRGWSLLPRASPAHLTSMLWGLAKYRVAPKAFKSAAFRELEDLGEGEVGVMDWVNLLYAAAGLKYHNRTLLRCGLDALAAPSVLESLSVSRQTEVALAVGSLRMYHP